MAPSNFPKGMFGRRTFLILLIFGSPATLFGDSWFLPERRSYYSENQQYRFDVIPKHIVSQLSYWQDKVDEAENPGAEEGQKETTAKGVFFVKDANGVWQMQHQFPLRNEVAPVKAGITNDGKYLVTFNDWHSMGYGENVVVLYRSDGRHIRHLSLADLMTESDISKMPHSVSSIHWLKGFTFNDLSTELMLDIAKCRRCPEPCICDFDLSILLKNGTLIQPLETRIPIAKGEVLISCEAIPPDKDFFNRFERLCDEHLSVGDFNFIETNEFIQYLNSIALPPIPDFFRKYRLRKYTCVLEIFVSKSGTVSCFSFLKGLPPGIKGTEPLEECVKTWRFEPYLIGGEAVPFRGRVQLDYILEKHCPLSTK